jgi:hypothetical protein
MGMQQGLAFYLCLLLLKVLEIFNFSVFHVQIVFYAPHHSHTSIQWNKIRNNHQTVPLTVYIRIKVQVELQADKSSVVVRDPSSLNCEPKVSNPWNKCAMQELI